MVRQDGSSIRRRDLPAARGKVPIGRASLFSEVAHGLAEIAFKGLMRTSGLPAELADVKRFTSSIVLVKSQTACAGRGKNGELFLTWPCVEAGGPQSPIT